jgi:hypothetical protein
MIRASKLGKSSSASVYLIMQFQVSWDSSLELSRIPNSFSISLPIIMSYAPKPGAMFASQVIVRVLCSSMNVI